MGARMMGLSSLFVPHYNGFLPSFKPKNINRSLVNILIYQHPHIPLFDTGMG